MKVIHPHVEMNHWYSLIAPGLAMKMKTFHLEIKLRLLMFRAGFMHSIIETITPWRLHQLHHLLSIHITAIKHIVEAFRTVH